MHIYDSLSASKQPLILQDPGHIRLYVCGVTVYDHCHIGHARVMLAFDMMVRYWRSQGYRVSYVCNITDIDDKIIQRAAALGEPVSALTERTIAQMHADQATLGIAPVDHQPRATEYIAAMQSLIEQLIDKGFAYQGASGEVLFSVQDCAEYGALSKRRLDELELGARQLVGTLKRHPMDFVLWKPAKAGEPSWPSPWGDGRPGWHIECSAMAMALLGETVDIHGGGGDLKFPHHENEIAQSESATGVPFARYWMHVGLLQINGEKMSKSLGNFLTITEACQQYHPECIRYFMLSAHYASPVNFSEQALVQAQTTLTRLYETLLAAHLADKPREDEAIAVCVADFHRAMQDDFNTPKALAAIFDCAAKVRARIAAGELGAAAWGAQQMVHMGEILGLLQQCPSDYVLQGASAMATEQMTQAQIDARIDEREQARQDRDWARADAIRDELLQAGVELKDGEGRTRWRRVH